MRKHTLSRYRDVQEMLLQRYCNACIVDESMDRDEEDYILWPLEVEG